MRDELLAHIADVVQARDMSISDELMSRRLGVRVVLRELIRIAAAWEASVPNADDQDGAFLGEIVKAVLEHQRSLRIADGREGRVVRRGDLIAHGLYIRVREALHAYRSGGSSAEAALAAVAAAASGAGFESSTENLRALVFSVASGELPPGTALKDLSAERLVDAWLHAVGGPAKAAATVIRRVMDRDARFAVDIERLLEERGDADDGQPPREARPQAHGEVDGLALLELEAETRGWVAGRLPPLRYLLVDVLGYPPEKATAVMRLLDAGRTVYERE